MPRRLKLFQTATGFHDAFVAAPSRKAALAAWGTDKDLFARGVAEEVDDAALLDRLSEAPGEVFRRLRGSEADQLEALGPAPSAPAKPGKEPRRRKPPKPTDKPVRDARAALAALDKAQATERAELAAQEAELNRRRRALETAQAKAMRTARAALDEAEAAHARALEEWRSA